MNNFADFYCVTRDRKIECLPARSCLYDSHAVSLCQTRIEKDVTLIQDVLDLRVLQTAQQSDSVLQQISLPHFLYQPSLRPIPAD